MVVIVFHLKSFIIHNILVMNFNNLKKKGIYLRIKKNDGIYKKNNIENTQRTFLLVYILQKLFEMTDGKDSKS